MIDRWFDRLTPRVVRRWATRIGLCSGPLPFLLLTITALGGDPWQEQRPNLSLMMYALALLTTVTAIIVAMGATMHLAIGRAFAQGYRLGQTDAETDTLHVPQRRRADLTLVE